MKYTRFIVSIIYLSGLISCGNSSLSSPEPDPTKDVSQNNNLKKDPLVNKNQQLKENLISSFFDTVKNSVGVYTAEINTVNDQQNLQKIKLFFNTSNDIHSQQLILYAIHRLPNNKDQVFCSLFTLTRNFFKNLKIPKNLNDSLVVKSHLTVIETFKNYFLSTKQDLINSFVEHRGAINSEEGIITLTFKRNIRNKLLLYTITPWQKSQPQPVIFLEDQIVPTFQDIYTSCKYVKRN